MSNWINPYTTILAFAAILGLLAWFKPQTGRIVFGVFFLIMALGVNVPIVMSDPTLFVAAGQNALLPIYQWFFTTVLAWNPVLFVIPLILFELTTGVLILSKGRFVRYGLFLAILFCLGITPVGIEEITAPALAIVAALLLRHPYPHSLIEMLGFHRPQQQQTA